jgi:hypothetical protein
MSDDYYNVRESLSRGDFDKYLSGVGTSKEELFVPGFPGSPQEAYENITTSEQRFAKEREEDFYFLKLLESF